MKPTTDAIVEISSALALWAHIMDNHQLDRLGECLTDDATWDGSIFGFEPVVGLDAIATVLGVPGHAKAHHTTNVVVSEGPADELRARSKGLSLLEDGRVASVVYADDLRRTDAGWRISRRVIHLTWPQSP